MLVSTRAIHTQTRISNEQLCKGIRHHIEDQLHAPLEDLKLIRRLITHQQGNRATSRQQLLASMVKTHAYFRKLQIADAEGTLTALYPTDQQLLGTNISHRPYFETCKKTNRVHYSPSEISEQFNTAVTRISLPLDGGVLTGVLALEELLTELPNGHSEWQHPPTLTITDQNAVFIAHSDPKKVKELAHDRNYNHLFIEHKAESFHHEVTLDGVRYLTNVNLIQPMGWMVAVHYPMEGIYAPAYRLAAIIAGGSFAILILATLLARLLAYRISRPLHRLMESIRHISRGDYTIAEGTERFLEFADLHSLFASMAKKVACREEEIRARETDHRIILNAIGDAVIAINADGTVLRMNPVAEALTGWPSEEEAGAPLEEVITLLDEDSRHPLTIPSADRIKGSALEAHQEEVLLIAHDGREKLVTGSLSAIQRPDEAPGGMVLVLRDVTELHRLEEQLRHSEKMQAIGQLAGGIAHDFNNMLGGIIGFAELLKMKATDSKLALYAERIIGAATRAADLTDKLLTFSRKGKRLSTVVEMHGIIREVVEILGRSIDKKVQITCHLDAEQSIITGDPSLLQNAILNLGVNARDAMPSGGTIHFNSRTQTVETNTILDHTGLPLTPGPYFILEVIDTGVGILPSLLDRIFEPFFTTKETGKGTGLGLAAVYGALQDHDGTIQVDSTPDKGTRFSLYLPLAQGSTVNPTPSSEDAVQTGQGTILLVDDEEVIRDMAEEILEDLGYEVICATDGEQAVDLYRTQGSEITAVILDMVMPKMNGREAFHAIRGMNPEATIYMASGFTQDHKVQHLKREGLAGFISKPYRLRELSRLLHTGKERPTPQPSTE
jgi:PAS domain S-box-containing protein